MLVGDSRQDFFERMSALGVLAADNAESSDPLSTAVAQADDARARVADAQQRAQRAAEEA
ncbi:hypothetical protein ACFYOT_25660 [Saccharothrix saharensis]|uniref:hypothetical protein n=1 Tax=Saccharothrix saharensis TaxID=571190 RepID=UPI0036B9B98F